ncbi:hypothetical protein [Kiloniella laminariae]|uniref:hypothetical protein n=1 Tax=Kiloniella laminariae TaxID=454162 RepID=UPI00037A8A55|nr:hypothetical protein [Kiloniella laminariae]
MKRFFGAILGCLLTFGSLSGCSWSDPVMLTASVGTLVYTDKTITDHFTSWAMAKDCSILYTSKGEAYCRDEELEADLTSTGYENLYCYRNIGGVTCYESPYEEASSQTMIHHSSQQKQPAVAKSNPAGPVVQ